MHRQRPMQRGERKFRTSQRADIRKTSVRCTLGCCGHTASCEAFCEFPGFVSPPTPGSQPQPAVKPSARLVFFYPYISGSARAFFPGGGQDGSQNGRFSTPSRKVAKEKGFFPVFEAGYLCRFFSPPGHYQEMHSKRRRLSAEPRLRAGGHARPLKCHSCLCPAIQGSRPACASVRRGHGVGIGKGRADIGHMSARRALGC